MSCSNVYVQKAAFNGQLIDIGTSAYISHSTIVNGGVLEFWMGQYPAAEFSKYY